MAANPVPPAPPGRLTRELEQAIHETRIAPVEWNMGEFGPRVEAIRRWRSVLREAYDAITAQRAAR